MANSADHYQRDFGLARLQKAQSSVKSSIHLLDDSIRWFS